MVAASPHQDSKESLYLPESSEQEMKVCWPEGRVLGGPHHPAKKKTTNQSLWEGNIPWESLDKGVIFAFLLFC